MVLVGFNGIWSINYEDLIGFSLMGCLYVATWWGLFIHLRNSKATWIWQRWPTRHAGWNCWFGHISSLYLLDVVTLISHSAYVCDLFSWRFRPMTFTSKSDWVMVPVAFSCLPGEHCLQWRTRVASNIGVYWYRFLWVFFTWQSVWVTRWKLRLPGPGAICFLHCT